MIGPTKIVLDRQSDLILTSPQITTPTGINAADIYDATKDQDLQTTVDAEISRAIAAEGSLATDLTAEASRAVAAEGSLDAALIAETSFRILAIQDAVQHEADARIYIDASLATKLSVETSARIADVDAEESRAMSAELVLTNDLSAEEDNRKNAITAEASDRIVGDLSLQNQIDFITENIDPSAIDSLTEIVAAFQSADGDINGAITTLADAAGANLSTEVARAMSAEGVLTAGLSTEVSARIADVDAEESRAIEAEGSLAADLATETYDRNVQKNSLEAALSTEASARIADVDAEESRAISAEADLAGSIASQISTTEELMTIADNSLYAQLNGQLEGEASTRLAADVSIAADLSNEVSNREFDLSSEISARMADVDAEESRATSIEGVLSADLSTEVSARIADVDAEESRAMSAELVLTNDLSTEIFNRETAVTAEASMRVDGDASLATDLAAETSRAISTEEALYEAASANLSTEVARAMSSEVVLALDLTAEISNRVSGDLSLQNQIDFITTNVDPAALDSLTEIVAAFQSADGDINGAITALSSTATSGLSTEVARAESAEAVLTADLSSEVSNRINHVLAVQGQLDDETTNRAISLSIEASLRVAAIDNEASIRLAADESLAADLGLGNLGLSQAGNYSDYLAYLDGSATFIDPYGDAYPTQNFNDDFGPANLANFTHFLDSTLAWNTSVDMTNEASIRLAADESLAADLSAEVSDRGVAIDAEASIRLDADASLESEIVALPDVDGLTIEVDASNFIRVMDTVAAPESGIRTFMGELDVETILKVNGVDVMAEISSEISARQDSETQLLADISDLALVDGTTIEVNAFDNTIRLMETIAAPDSGIRTFMGLVDVDTQPADNGNFNDLSLVTKYYVDQADANLGVRIDTAIANTDFSQIDSIAEVIELYHQKIEFVKNHGSDFVEGDSSTWNIALNYYFKDNSEAVYFNGLLLEANGEDYNVSDNIITFSASLNMKPSDKVIVYAVTNKQAAQFQL